MGKSNTHPFRVIFKHERTKLNAGGFINMAGTRVKVTSIKSVKWRPDGIEIIGMCKEVKENENPISQFDK
jgi:hypothetical protein